MKFPKFPEGFDPIKENEDAERRWCEKIVVPELWEPLRDALHNHIVSEWDQQDRCRHRINALTVVAIIHTVAIIALAIYIVTQ